MYSKKRMAYECGCLSSFSTLSNASSSASVAASSLEAVGPGTHPDNLVYSPPLCCR